MRNNLDNKRLNELTPGRINSKGSTIPQFIVKLSDVKDKERTRKQKEKQLNTYKSSSIQLKVDFFQKTWMSEAIPYSSAKGKNI